MLSFSTDRKSGLFFKYLVSYMAILCVPLVVTIIFVFGHFNRVLEREITARNLDILAQVNNTIDNRMLECNSIANRIFNNYRLKPRVIAKSTINRMEAIQELNNYCVGNDFVQNLVLYVKGTDFLISAAGTYDVSNFINYVYRYENWKHEDFVRDINEITGPVFRRPDNVYLSGSRNTERFITYLVPGDQLTVIFLLKESKVKSLLTLKSADVCENTVILDSESNIVTSVKDVSALHSEIIFNHLKPEGKDGTGIVEIRDMDYFYSYIKSEVTGWIYATVIPERDALKPVFNVKEKALYIWLVIFLLGSGVIYYITNRNYYPIWNLRKLAEERLGQQMSGNNEIEVVKSAINKIAENGIELKKSLNQGKTAIKEALLLELIRGQVETCEKFNLMGKDIGLVFSKPIYTVCVLYSKMLKDLNSARRSGIIKEIENALPASMEGYGRDGMTEGTIILVLAMDEFSVPLIRDVMIKIKDQIKIHDSVKISVGVGNGCNKISQIGRAFIEASTAIDYKFIMGDNKVIFYNEITINSIKNFDYPEKELNDFRHFIRQGNIEAIEETLNSIIRVIKESDMPIVIARCICFDVFNSVLKTVNEIGIITRLSESGYFDTENLNRFNTPEELTEIIMAICRDLCQDIRKSKESKNTSLIEKMIKYIEDNCEDQNFSVKLMADNFGMSQSYLSRFFKSQTGQTLSEYQLKIRMEKAKHYLKSTNEPIKNIVNKVGYCSESSFVRLFRETEGITPGEFRKLAQEM